VHHFVLVLGQAWFETGQKDVPNVLFFQLALGGLFFELLGDREVQDFLQLRHFSLLSVLYDDLHYNVFVNLA